jgi:DNA-binding response OmpR family regulator
MTIRVLLVEPDALLLEIYAHCLTRKGFEVARTDGHDGIAQLHSWQPDVVVLEPEMPNSLGERFLAEVLQEFGHVPVIILTRGVIPPTVQERCECHIKPFRMSALADAIRATLMPTGERL